jgi:putative endonuclease
MSKFYVYILASGMNGTIYVGVTKDLRNRIWQHKQGINESFTKKYHVYNLVYFEEHASILVAVAREKQIKKVLLFLTIGIGNTQAVKNDPIIKDGKFSKGKIINGKSMETGRYTLGNSKKQIPS